MPQRPSRRPRGRPPHPDVLTPAEWRVLEHVRAGLTNADIATRLEVSSETVKTHVSNMLAKLQLDDRYALARWSPADGRKRGWPILGLGVLVPLWTAIRNNASTVALGGAALITVAVVAALLVALVDNGDTTDSASTPVPERLVAPIEGPSQTPAALDDTAIVIANEPDPKIQRQPSGTTGATPLLRPIISNVWPARNAVALGFYLPSDGVRPPDIVVTYRIVVEPGSRVVAGIWDPTSHCCNVLVDNLENGIEYSFAVSVTSAAGTSPTSERSDPVAPVANSLGAPFSSWISLDDGRVLFFGGGNDGRQADLFDPATATFSPTGSLQTAGRFHGATATLLEDGTVLIAGGGHDGHHLASVELYDPVTGIFSSAGAMTEPRWRHDAARLRDGRVLLFGGGDVRFGGPPTTATAEIYDPTTGRFSPTGGLLAARSEPTVTLLQDGRVLVTGGTFVPAPLETTQLLQSAEVYDPLTSTFRAIGDLSTPRHGHRAFPRADGSVAIVSGFISGGCELTVEVFDPGSDAFTLSNFEAPPLCRSALALLPDGRLLEAHPLDDGGRLDIEGGAVVAVIVDLDTGAVEDVQPPTFSWGGAIALQDGRVLRIGATYAEIFDPATATFTRTTDLASPAP